MTLPWKAWIAQLQPWLVRFALIGAGVFLWNREHGLRLSAEQDAEAQRLAREQQIVEAQSTKKELQGSLDEQLAQNAALAAAFNDAMKAAPDAKPASSSRLDTGPLIVKLPPPPPTPAPPTAARPAPAVDPCVLRPGDAVSVTMDSIELLTGKGNTLVVGAASVYREIPPPRLLLAQGKFQSALSTSRELATAAPPRWGALALGVCGASGCGPGIGVLLPPVTLPLVGWRADTFLGIVAAPGALLVLGGIGVRW